MQHLEEAALLRQQGHRLTPQRLQVLQVIKAHGQHMTAEEIHAAILPQQPYLDIATVYRTLQLMTEAGDVDAIRTNEGETAYRRCSTGHHHHLVCRTCGRTVEVSGPAVERWANAVAEQHGFREISHDLEIFGTCNTC